MLKGGSNFSAGERQALAMGRAVLHARQIIAMDEPTANIDAKTDELLQKMLRKMFDKRTLLCIAHRLQTVIEMDKIVVMANGRVRCLGHEKQKNLPACRPQSFQQYHLLVVE